MTHIIEYFSEISSNYDAVFCDLWGCLHNGRRPFEAAVKALEDFRDGGRIVLLLTNSPRPKASVEIQLDEIGVARDLYHEVATSGDSARSALASCYFGNDIFHIGPDRDTPFLLATTFRIWPKLTAFRCTKLRVLFARAYSMIKPNRQRITQKSF